MNRSERELWNQLYAQMRAPEPDQEMLAIYGGREAYDQDCEEIVERCLAMERARQRGAHQGAACDHFWWEADAPCGGRRKVRRRPTRAPTRSVGRPRDSIEEWQRKRDRLKTAVIRVAEQGWERWPDKGPNQKYVAHGFDPLVTETAVRGRLRHYRLDFKELIKMARPTISLRKCAN